MSPSDFTDPFPRPEPRLKPLGKLTNLCADAQRVMADAEAAAQKQALLDEAAASAISLSAFAAAEGDAALAAGYAAVAAYLADPTFDAAVGTLAVLQALDVRALALEEALEAIEAEDSRFAAAVRIAETVHSVFHLAGEPDVEVFDKTRGLLTRAGQLSRPRTY